MGIFEPFLYVIGLLVSLYLKVVVVQIVLYWLIHFKVLEADNKYSQKTMEILDKVTLPVYKKIGEKIPPFNGIDFSPFILVLALIFLGRLIYKEKNIPYYPGCVTPTEIMAALELGITTVKFFPANVYGGLKALKALSAPFPQVKFIPTGGVDRSNIDEFLAFDKIAAIGGSFFVKESLDKMEANA